MHGPNSITWLLVALCAASGAYCVLRMRSGVEEQRRTAGSEALMGFGMAVMALPAAVVTPPRAAWAVYVAVFGAAALRALWAARSGAHHLHHLVGAFAMVYMAVAMAARPGEHAGHAGAGTPLVTGPLLLYFAGYVLWSGARLVPVTMAGGGPPVAGWGDRPELARACRLSMGIATVAMLLTM
ncbi:DUF5134 domain-containing protein [Streptomyces antimycoticus]|uniref:DUF5134 domain-containing protein n=1 Tax=Streptomyces antimycoticus TaxID=68175 RepID=UPI001F27EF7D|nr:DUF5134 domain-containing protein [Streptomyces antimycoticus]